ncbi:MAG: PASTA domain-containing protein [Acidobacteriota bacterium]
MPFGTRVRRLGRLLVIAGALLATFVLFASIAMRVAIRAREVPTPELVGRPVDEATRLAADHGLTLRVDDLRRADATVPVGHVVAQDPPPGATTRRQRAVRVWLSGGQKVAVAPALVGESERAARMRLAEEGLGIAPVAEIRSRLYPPDVVVAQDPAPAVETSEVRLLVNRGEDRVVYVMPDLIGLNGERAAQVLRSQGFRVAIVAQQAASGIPPGVVLRQQPAGGYQVHPGDPISLEVSR